MSAPPVDLPLLVARVASSARVGEQVEAYAAHGYETDVVVYDGQIESLSTATSAGVGVRVVVDDRQGFAYAGSLDEDVVAETLAEARDNATFGTPDPHLGLAVPDGVEPAVLDLWREELAELSTATKVDMAMELEKLVKGGDPRIRTVKSASYGDTSMQSAVATSTGIAVSSRRTGCYLATVALAGEGDENFSGIGYSVGRGPGELDAEEAAADAVERSTRMIGATKPASGRLPVVFDRRVTTALLSILAGTLSGDAVLKGRSLFAERVGEQVGVPGLDLVDDPTNPLAYRAAAYDSEGLACRRNVLISDGVLQGFVYNTYAGRRAGLASTASAVRGGFRSTPGIGCRALSLRPGELDQDEVLASVGEGLFVQSISGVHSGVNGVSGDFSVGAEGLMVRGGVVAEPVRELTIASTLQRMLAGIVAVGNDVEWLPGPAAGVTLAVDGMSISGA